MASATLALDGYSKSDNLSIIVCHVHFCGLPEPNASKITSFWLPRNDGTKGKASVTFTVPSIAEAVCVTLVWRYKGGWLRHGRCRFSSLLSPKSVPHSALQLSDASTKASNFPWNLDETKNVLFESTLMSNGTATLSFLDKPGMGFRGPKRAAPSLIRDWFYVPKSSCDALARFLVECKWYAEKQPIDEGIRKVHMPYWNNKVESLPGWFFAFERSAAPRYDQTDFIDVFSAAKTGILGWDTINEPQEQSLTLAWGLSIFGLSVQYQPDKHFGHMDKPVERFSSNARLDGIGDCEDIAKEICMAHADLCKLPEMKNLCYDVIQIKARARRYKCVIMLGTVSRYSAPDKTLAHAFAMLVPNWFFNETHPVPEVQESPEAKMKREKARAKEREQHPGPMLCDATYPAYPVLHDEWKRPWKHHHIVSALIMGEGEIYFTDTHAIDENSYGIAFDDFFPAIKDNVGFAFTHTPLSPEDVGHVESILASNLPIQKHTFGFEHQSIVSRFVSVWSHKAGDFARLNHYCEKGLVNPSYFDKADKCLDQRGYDRLMTKTSSYAEMAFTMGEDGHLEETHEGKYGSVARGNTGLGVGGHSHHRETDKDYRLFNVPTPEDVMTFCSHRAFSVINDMDHVRNTELVITHANVYDVADKNDADGVVSEIVAKFKTWSPEKTTPAVLLMKVWAAVTRAFMERGVYDTNRGLQWEDCLVTKFFNERVFTDKDAADAYLKIYEESAGVTIKQVPVAEYEETCGLVHSPDE